MFRDPVGDSSDRFVQFGRDWFYRELLEADHERVGEAVHAVAMLQDVLPLDVVQHVADFLGRVLVVVQERDEIGNRPLKVDVVLPERVIGVDEQVLARRNPLRDG